MQSDPSIMSVLEELLHASTVSFWVSVAGGVIGLFGFILVIVQLRKTKGAAEAASTAAREAVNSVSANQSLSDLGSVIGGLKEIQTANRGELYETALLRIQTVREQLSALRARDHYQENETQKNFQRIATFLSMTQATYDKYLLGEQKLESVAAVNDRLADYIVGLSGLKQQLENTIGENNAVDAGN